MTLTILPGQKGIDAALYHKAAQIKAAGFTFVVRYISNTSTSWKVLTPAERDELLAAGLGIVLVFETSSTASAGGARQGAIDGVTAARQARALGYPTDIPILAAIDTASPPNLLPTQEAYLRAFHTGCQPYPMGVYGGTPIIDAVADICSLGWQANASSWSPHPSANVHVHQRPQDGVHGWDPNLCVKTFAAWSTTPVPPATKPPIQTIPPIQGDADMAEAIQTDDNDAAIFIVQGALASWARSWADISMLTTNGFVKASTPRKVPRATLKALQLVGDAPTYPAGYAGPRTTAADFGSAA